MGAMAEGDTILRLVRRFEASLVGENLEVAAPHPRGRAAGVERLNGRRLDRADAHGKHLLLHFDDLVLHSHLGMSGGWHLYPRGASWRRPRSSAWAVLGGSRQDAVQFGGPSMKVVAAGRLHSDPQLARLGPDLLAQELDLEAVLGSLRAEPTRTIGDALLDQTVVAGIGNIFKSEACFAARLDPWRRIADLTDDQLRAVLLTARELMQQAVATGRPPHAVYRRRGPCGVCGGRVAARGQGDANRTTYWCPSCQG
jgi:endonuclease-8